MTNPETDDLSSQLASLRLARDEAPAAKGGHRWLFALAAVAGLAVLAAALLREHLARKTVAVAAVLLVQPGQEAPLFVATGTVAAPLTATLAPRTAGRLSKLFVLEGDEVTAGQPVALLDDADAKLAFGQARADLASAEAKVEAARVAVKAAQVREARATRLFHGGAGTEGASEDASLDLDAARAQIEVAKADVGLARARLAIAARNVEDTILRAPFRGVVLRVLAQPGDFVATAMSQGVLQLGDLSTLEVDAEVAESNLSKLIPRMPVEVRLDALPGRAFSGRVFSVRPGVDPAKATAIAKVRFELLGGGATMAIYPGMNGRISFVAHPLDAAALARPPRLEVPASAVERVGEVARIVVLEKDGRVRAVSVVTAGTDGDRVVLRDGPPAGTSIVVAPEGLHPGDRVQAQQEP